MTRRSLVGRSDLYNTIISSPRDDVESLASLLGYAYSDGSYLGSENDIERKTLELLEGRISIEIPPEAPDEPDTTYILAKRYTRLDTLTGSENAGSENAISNVDSDEASDDVIWQNQPKSYLPIPTLRPADQMAAMLRRMLTRKRPVGPVDVRSAIDRLAQGKVLRRLARQKVRHRPHRIFVLYDRSRHLSAFWPDQDWVIGILEEVFPQTRLVRCSRNGLLDDRTDLSCLDTVDENDLCLALTDFGILNRSRSEIQQWQNIARSFEAGCALALTPTSAEEVPSSLRDLWHVETWASGKLSDVETRLRHAEEILTLLGPALVLEPSLIRLIRHEIIPDADAATEAVLWSHPWIDRATPSAARFTKDASSKLQFAFENADDADLPLAKRRAALSILRHWRASGGKRGLGHDIWFAELLNLGPVGRNALPDIQDLDDARRYFAGIAAKGRTDDGLAHGVKAWLSRIGDNAPEAWKENSFRAAVWPIKKTEKSFVPPVQPALLSSSDDVSLTIDVLANEGQLILTVPPSNSGKSLAILPSANGLVEVDTSTDQWSSIWGEKGRPAWVSHYGRDAYGLWATFEYGYIVQKLRWIPPGTFQMGSSLKKERVPEHEQPQHAVEFKRGFWMFDTTCTQRLWDAVLDRNNSAFKGPDLPMDRVSKRDCEEFIDKIGQLISDLHLSLPSESQWEYACRSGTTSNYSFGDKIRFEQVNCYNNYRGAKSHDSHWTSRGRTVPVATLPPNNWGLFEMHGNVWEWCLDHWHDHYRGAPTEGEAWASYPSSVRVLRGGAWNCQPNDVRSAARNRDSTGDRGGTTGFRCVINSAGDSANAVQSNIKVNERLSEGATIETTLPQSPFVIRTDIAQLELGPTTKPKWAQTMGQDIFGCWADFQVKTPRGEIIKQRMRWIPPGEFFMGSPDSEKGRHSNEGPEGVVVIREAYWIFDTACTQALWRAVTSSNPSIKKGNQRPVENVTLPEVQQFIRLINQQIPGIKLSIPSEAEWEYACRARTVSPFNFGDKLAQSVANFDKGPPTWAVLNAFSPTAVDVKTLPPNAWGLFEMHGNVAEWCADEWHDSYENAPLDGTPRSDTNSGNVFVVRGGSYASPLNAIRSAARDYLGASQSNGRTGFRCVRRP